MKPSPVCYLEIPAPKLEAAGTFYRSVFNWKIEPNNLHDRPYWMFSFEDNSLMGALDPNKNSTEKGILIYISVDNIESHLRLAKSANARVVREKYHIGEGFGFAAIVEDPNGNHIGIWSKQ